MFGIDSPELLVIAIVALVVIGPKELPGMLRSWGNWMAKMRGMASEFRGHVDEMVRQSELDEVKKQLVAEPQPDATPLVAAEAPPLDSTPVVPAEAPAPVEIPAPVAADAKPVEP